MARPREKVILFIVEGTSDMHALERPIMNLLQAHGSEYKVRFLPATTDVTSDFRNNPDNILDVIAKHYFRPFFSGNDCYAKYVVEVVHLCDLDGTFIPPENCRPYDSEHTAEKGFIYDSQYIYGRTAEEVIDRNRRKAENLEFLFREVTSIKVKRAVPYSIYFFSSNIEHYLHDKINLCTRDKINLSEAFADKCDDDPDWFLRRLCRHNRALTDMTYEESWEFVMTGLNSLKRYTNFNIFLEKLLSRIHEESN